MECILPNELICLWNKSKEVEFLNQRTEIRMAPMSSCVPVLGPKQVELFGEGLGGMAYWKRFVTGGGL